MCLYPKLIENPKYRPNKKNNYNPPDIWDDRIQWVPIGCQNCIECRRKKAREWQVRLQEEIRHNKDMLFVTLTFSNESIIELSKDIETADDGYIRDNAISTLAVRRFLERWRKKNGKSIKHWLVTELGHEGTENIHLHGFIFSQDKEQIKNTWKYGRVWIGQYVNERTVNYITKYITKMDFDHQYYKPMMYTSPGIGGAYLTRADHKRNQYNGKNTREYYLTKSGSRLSLPIYYRNKIYNDEERETLWVLKLNKRERYVLGQRIRLDLEGEETYFQNLKTAQELNIRLGYGKRDENWERKMYEIEQRNVNYRRRVEHEN